MAWLAVVMAACAALSRPTAAQAPIRVTMAWPVNTTVDARTVRTVLNRTGASADSTQFSARSQFRVRTHPNGLLIEMEEAPPETLQMKDTQITAMYMPADAARQLVVTRAGRFLGLEDTATLAQRKRESLLRGVPAEVAASPQFQAQISQLMSVKRTIERSRIEWDDLIGRLVDRDWIAGRTETDTILMSDAAVPGLQVSRVRRQLFRGEAECPSESNAMTCWRFDLSEEIDTTALRLFVRNNASSMGMSASDAASAPLPYQTTFTTHVLDAATARPLRQESATVFLTPREGGDHTLLSRNVTTYVWRPM